MSWNEKRANIVVLKDMGKERERITSIKTRKFQYLGRTMRAEDARKNKKNYIIP